MDVTPYHYIAENSPRLAQQIIESFGYRVVDKNRMGDNLQELVANEGEEALKMVMNNHPEKDIILELFSEKDSPCQACQERSVIEKYVSANGGSEKSEAKIVENNFSILFLAGITILAVAIIKK